MTKVQELAENVAVLNRKAIVAGMLLPLTAALLPCSWRGGEGLVVSVWPRQLGAPVTRGRVSA